MLRAFFLISIFLFSVNIGCNRSVSSSSISTDEKSLAFDQAEFENNQNKWRNANIDNYSMKIEASGYLRPWVPAVISVRGAQFSSIRPIDPNVSQQSADMYLELKVTTIDEAFAVVKQNSSGKNAVFKVSYDNALGYPDFIYIDHSENVADDEIRIRIKDLATN